MAYKVKTISLASDEDGFFAKSQAIGYLKNFRYLTIDRGVFPSLGWNNYHQCVLDAASDVGKGSCTGIVFCKDRKGFMEIMAQRKSDDANGVIYAICDTKEQARLARTMHSANLLCISKFDLGEIDKIYRAFLGIDE